MKFVTPSKFTDPDAAVRKLLEIVNGVEPDHAYLSWRPLSLGIGADAHFRFDYDPRMTLFRNWNVVNFARIGTISPKDSWFIAEGNPT
jgi:hypothetical protein